jgi:hypothetical protein
MLLDLTAILLIVILSFIFCYKDNNYSCQVSHIIIGLSVIVFYKLAKWIQLNIYIKSEKSENNKKQLETFQNSTANLINDFINGNQQGIISQAQATTLSQNELSIYNNKLQQLIDSLQQLNANSQQSTLSPEISSNPANLNKLDLEATQQYQMFVIDYLNNQLNNAKDIINQQNVANVSSNYKPIKVYSSCVISNANGTNSIQEIPVNSNSTISGGNSPAQQIFQTTSQSSATNPSVPVLQQQMQQQSRFINTPVVGSSTNPLNLSAQTGVLGDLVNKVLSGGSVNLNIK